MSLDIVLAMPLTAEQIFIGVVMIVCLYGATISLVLKQIFGAIVFMMLFVAMLWFFIGPTIIAVIPDPNILPQPWRDMEYNMMHPETWFNITVVWPK